MTECTDRLCDNEAKFAYWMGHGFARVQEPDDPELDHGDLHPFVCQNCRDRMASSPHWDAEKFVRPSEKLVVPGGDRR